ncbi:MAG: hypothetical protein H6569_11495 [Lewinellaceae bacterium]|nr:hypothetical protein [Lewinellaceae bacterium]
MKNHQFLFFFTPLAIYLAIFSIQHSNAFSIKLWLAFSIATLPLWLVLLWIDIHHDRKTKLSNKSTFRWLAYIYITLVYSTWVFCDIHSWKYCTKENEKPCLYNTLYQAVWVPGFEIVLIIFILVFVYRNPAKKTITARESALEHTCRELLKTGEMAQAIQLLRQRAYQQQREQLQNDLVVLSASRVFTVKEYQNKKITKLVHDEYLAMLGDELMKLASRF